MADERALPGPDLIRVAIRSAGRLDRPTAVRDIGRGDLRLVRVGGGAVVHLPDRRDRVAESWVGDASSTGLPEAALAP